MIADNRLAAAMRATARDIFLAALSDASIQKAFPQHVDCNRNILRIYDDLYDLSTYTRVFVVSIGKAAHAMAEALASQVGGGLVGIVVGTSDPPSQVAGFRYYRGGHPLPNAESLRAGETILRALNAHTSRSLVIYMISGGGSAAVEKPITDDITLQDLVATYGELVHSGAPIAEINAIRKHLSAVKGGRMARAAHPAQQVSILVSDVPENALDSLASGPTMPDTSTVEDCYAIAQQHALLKKFPKSVRELFEQRALEETPKPDDLTFQRSRWWPVLSNATAQKAAVAQAATRGFAVEVDNSCDDWDYARAADHLLGRLRELRRGVSRACLISGGEVTVKVAGKSGIGGRNQQFALYCATQIEGENIAVLSAGTDGIDGNSPAAGAVADGTTVQRARATGVDVRKALADFDAYRVFENLEDAIVTGPTGNNIRDLRILLAY
jgi:hydroxypyruvate reductase